MKTKSIGIILAAVLVLGATAFGQNRGQMGGGQNRDRVRDNLATLRLLRLTQALDLTEEQTAKIFPTINRIEKEKTRIQRDMGVQIRDLRVLLQDPAPKDDKILPLLKSLKVGRETVRSLDVELEAFLEAYLTLAQSAKYVLFNIDFMRNLTNAVNRTGALRGNNAPPPIKK
jgi:hypothetical protein